MELAFLTGPRQELITLDDHPGVVAEADHLVAVGGLEGEFQNYIVDRLQHGHCRDRGTDRGRCDVVDRHAGTDRCHAVRQVPAKRSDGRFLEQGNEPWRGQHRDVAAALLECGVRLGDGKRGGASQIRIGAEWIHASDRSHPQAGGKPRPGATLTAPAIDLQATGYKVKGVQHVDLTWSDSGAGSYDVYRDDVMIDTATGTSYTDNLGIKGGGGCSYRVCEAGT